MQWYLQRGVPGGDGEAGDHRAVCGERDGARDDGVARGIGLGHPERRARIAARSGRSGLGEGRPERAMMARAFVRLSATRAEPDVDVLCIPIKADVPSLACGMTGSLTRDRRIPIEGVRRVRRPIRSLYAVGRARGQYETPGAPAILVSVSRILARSGYSLPPRAPVLSPPRCHTARSTALCVPV